MNVAKSNGESGRPGGPGGDAGMLSLDDLRSAAKDGTIDTVVTAFTDMQGRLFGKRIVGEYFLDDVIEEVLHLDALAEQPALHVGKGGDDGVDRAVFGLLAQVVERQHPRCPARAARPGSAFVSSCTSHSNLPFATRR